MCKFSFSSKPQLQFDMRFCLECAIFVGYLQKSISVAISRKILHCAIIGLLLLLLLSIWGNSFFGWWYVILCVHHLVPCLIKVKFKLEIQIWNCSSFNKSQNKPANSTTSDEPEPSSARAEGFSARLCSARDLFSLSSVSKISQNELKLRF